MNKYFERKIDRKKTMTKKKNILATIYIGAILLVLSYASVSYATSSMTVPVAKCYEWINEGSNYDTFTGSKINKFCYGGETLGSFVISGNIEESSTYGESEAYQIDGELTLGYEYDGAYSSGIKEAWNLISSDSKSIDGNNVSAVKVGCVLVQKSVNGVSYNTVFEKNDLFKKGAGADSIYTISKEDVDAGTYYRVYIAYKMQKKIGEKNVVGSLIKEPIYDTREFLEEYNLYVYPSINPVVVKKVNSFEAAKTGSAVDRGIVVDKNGVNCKVSITKDGSVSQTTSDMKAIYAPGKYVVTTDYGVEQFETSVSVTEGRETVSITPNLYEGGKDGKYSEEGYISGYSSFGMYSLSKLTISQGADNRISIAKNGDMTSYGISSSWVELNLHLVSENDLRDKGWRIASDTYGKKDNELIDGVVDINGPVSSGALIVQKKTSPNGDWINVDAGAYATGLSTTDFYKNYKDYGEVLIYTPDGTELVNGLYLRVLYAYEIEDLDGKNRNRCLETYEMYLCSSNLGAVTFHNMTVSDELDELLGAEDEINADLYKLSESMISGSCTTTGFKIDTSANPTVKYSVTKNGSKILNSTNNEYTATGKYEITLESNANDKETVVIYVDSESQASAYQRYFGDNPLEGKRIFSYGMYPVYEAGYHNDVSTSFGVNAVDGNYLPISGKLWNIDTGEEIEFLYGYQKRNDLSAGHWYGEFSTKPAYAKELESGDSRNYKFEFDVIENGAAPGPIVNEQSLNEYARSNVSDAYPMYYGVTRIIDEQKVTLAFFTYDEALAYAYNYERSHIEKQNDGTYRYTGSMVCGQKDHYYSGKDIADATYEYAKEAVNVGFFDLSDPFTYRTLDFDEINAILEEDGDLKDIDISKDVVIFAPGQKDLFCNFDDDIYLPVISPKPANILAIGNDKIENTSLHDFEFVRDKYGYDSDKVVITDCNGKSYNINYTEGVGKQLEAYACPTGKVTITELTIYGDINQYEAIFIAENDNTAKVTINYYENGSSMSKDFYQTNDGEKFIVDAFTIESLIDEMDPYSIVKVENIGVSQAEYFVADQVVNKIWASKGDYTVSIINRLGYSYSFVISIEKEVCISVSFTGEGTEGEEYNPYTIYCDSSRDNKIELPTPTRAGYTFVGFKDADGTIYSDGYIENPSPGDIVLETVWVPIPYKVSIVDQFGNKVCEYEVRLGETIELNIPELKEGESVVSWSFDGANLESNLFTLTEEKDVTIIADIMGRTQKNNNYLIVVLVIIGGSIAAGFGYKKYRDINNSKGTEDISESFSEDKEEQQISITIEEANIIDEEIVNEENKNIQ